MPNITLSFKGTDYKILENSAFEVAEEVEEIVTLAELAKMQTNPKFVKIAKCLGVMLRFAGAKVSDKDVHSEIIREIAGLSEEDAGAAKDMLAAQAIGSLMAVLMDGAPIDDEAPAPEKTKASSKRRSKSRSKSSA